MLSFIKRHVPVVAFVAGFVWDLLTLVRIDLVYENVVFVSYLVFAFCGIILIHSVETGRWAPPLLVRYRVWLPALVQFPFGGLFSAFLIFYTKSASLVTSWPFLTLLVVLFVGNELFRRRYERLVFQIGVLYFCLTSYLILVTPIVLGTMGTSTFVLATLVSLFVLAVLLQVVMRFFPDLYRRSVKGIWWTVGGMFFCFHVLYFTNTIPPVPLALTEIGVYHHVARSGSEYEVRYEVPDAYRFWRSTAYTFHRPPNGAAYCFSAVFAPTTIRTNIYHSWQRKNAEGKWVREERIGFPVAGGREGGYRGFTVKRSLPEGEWRCVVETESRHVVGEVFFEVVNSPQVPVLVSGVR